MQRAKTLLHGMSAMALVLAAAGPGRAALITSSSSMEVNVRHHNSLGLEAAPGGPLNGLIYEASSVDASGFVVSQGSGFAANGSSGGTAFFHGEFSKVAGTQGGYFSPVGNVRYNFSIDAATTLLMEFTNETSRVVGYSAGRYELTDGDGKLVARSNGEAVPNAFTDYILAVSAGEYVLHLEALAYDNIVYSPGSGASGVLETVIRWGLGSLPGSTPDNPILPNVITPDEFIFDIVTNVADSDGGTENENMVFYDPEIAVGYDFVSGDVNFASVLVPDALPGGDSLFELVFGDMVVSLHAGEIFDFTSVFAEGVSEFGIRGIDPSEGLATDDPLAFVTGLSFVEGGQIDRFTMSPISASPSPVPEPSSLVLFGMGVCGLFGYGRRRRSANPE